MTTRRVAGWWSLCLAACGPTELPTPIEVADHVRAGAIAHGAYLWITDDLGEHVLWKRSFDGDSEIELDRAPAVAGTRVLLMAEPELIVWGTGDYPDWPLRMRIVDYEGRRATPLALPSWSLPSPIFGYGNGDRTVVLFSCMLPDGMYPDLPYRELPWMIEADVDASTETPLFPTRVESLQPATRQGDTAWVRGATLGGAFLATFDLRNPTGLDIVRTDLGADALLVGPDTVFVVEAPATAPTLYRLEGRDLVAIAELGHDAVGGPVWAADALWFRVPSTGDLLRVTAEGHQARFATAYGDAVLLAGEDRLGVLIPDRPIGQPAAYRLLEQPLPD